MSRCSKCGAEGPFLSLSTWNLCPACREKALSNIVNEFRLLASTFAVMKYPPDGKAWISFTGSMIRLLDLLAAILPQNLLPDNDSPEEPGPFALEEIRILLGSNDLDEPGLRCAASMLDNLLPFIEARSPENMTAFLKLRSKVFSALAKTDRDRAASLGEKKHTASQDHSQLSII